MKNTLRLLACLLFSITGTMNGQDQIGNDIIPTTNSEGTGINVRVSADGNRMIFGSRLATINGDDFAGAARVYENTNGSWEQLGQILEGDSEFEFFGETVDISNNGERIVVGSDDQARVYSLDGSQWLQLGQDITVPNMNNVRELSMSSNGEILGVLYTMSSGDFELHVYNLIGNVWEPLGTPFVTDLDRDFVLDGSGTRLGIHFDETNDRIRMYDFENGDWQQIGADFNSDTDYYFDNSEISADGNTLFIFSSNNTVNGVPGYLNTYNFTNGNWVESSTQLDFPMDNVSTTSMAPSANGQQLAFATSDDNFEDDFNSVKLYELIGNEWQQAGAEIQIWAHDEQLPNYVAITADGSKVSHGSLLSAPGVIEGTIRAYDYQAVLNTIDQVLPVAISVYPNPTSGAVQLKLSSITSNITITVYNMLGQKISKEEFQNQSNPTIHIEGSSGIYLVKVQSAEGISETIKVIKK